MTETFPEKANKIENFIPNRWKIVVIKEGDLNNDNINDIVLIIEKNNPKDIRESGLKYIIFRKIFNNKNFLLQWKYVTMKCK